MLVAGLMGGCSSEANTAGPEAGVTVSELQEPDNFYEDDYVGQQVTVSAQVADVLDPRHLEPAGRDYGEDSLLIRTAQPVEVRQGQVVRATGTLGQYHVLLEIDPPPRSRWTASAHHGHVHHQSTG